MHSFSYIHQLLKLNITTDSSPLQSQLSTSYEELLSSLDQLSGNIHENYEFICKQDIMDIDNMEAIKKQIQQIEVLDFHFYNPVLR